MLYGEYTFKCRFQTEAFLPTYKGSTFRGGFGKALKQVTCALKRQDCRTCLLKAKCLYLKIFEPRLVHCPDLPVPANARPHPFVLQPPVEPHCCYPVNDAFEFRLLLFGDTTDYLPYLIYTVEKMGKTGIGRKIQGRRGCFVLESVQRGGRTIYSSADRQVKAGAPLDELQLACRPRTSGHSPAVTVHLITPLRIKYRNALSPELPFHILTRTMLRRTAALLNAFGQGEPALDYPGMASRAEKVRVRKAALGWEEFRRYSHRQDRAMMMGGIRGQITYQGDLDEFLPLMAFCEKVHIGKQTTFGLGRIAVEVLP